MHCVDCNDNMGALCAAAHRRMKPTAAHQQIPLEDVLAGNLSLKRIPRCQKHIGYEIDSYCKTCTEAICAKCRIEKHPKHDFCPLSQVTGPLQDQIAGYTITMTKKEKEAKKAITTLDGTINRIEDQARNETLEKLQFPTQSSSVSHVFEFSPGNMDEVKKAISTLGSFIAQ